MKTIEEMIAVMTAYKEGKRIEYKLSLGNVWERSKIPRWDWVHYDYRIKPEEPKPTYRPYQSAEEILEDMRLHGPMVKYKEKTAGAVEYNFIRTIWGRDIFIDLNTEESTFPEAFEEVTWQDGTPFGRRVEE